MLLGLEDNSNSDSNRERFDVSFYSVEDGNEFRRYRMNVRDPDWKVPTDWSGIWINGRVDPDDPEYRWLLDLLSHSDKTWICIHLKCQHDNGSSSPSFLALLVATFRRTSMLHLNDCMPDVPSFSCLNGGLAATNGLKRIVIEQSQPFTEEQMSMFAEGLSQTKDLEYLSLKDVDLRRPRIADALAAGLEANDSLRCLILTLCVLENDSLSRVLVPLHGHSKLNRLEVLYRKRLSPIEYDSIRDWLSRNDCKLERLSLREQYDITREDRRRQVRETELDRSPVSDLGMATLRRPNESVRDLQLERMAIESSVLQRVLSNFTNLVSLDLSLNKISDLQPFDSLLIGENCTLETLVLADNPVSLRDTLVFARKLPKMKVLRNLEFPAREMYQNLETGAFEKFSMYCMKNTSLERISTEFSSDAGGMIMSHPKLEYAMLMNRAARRYFRRNQCDSSLELFSTILARVTKIRYYRGWDERWGKPPQTWHGFDAVFWLLRENSTFQSSISPQSS